MADVGKSQTRQVGNLGNTVAGETGKPIGSRGEAYYKFGSTKDRQTRVSQYAGARGRLSPTTNATFIPNTAEAYTHPSSTQDALNRTGMSVGVFGGTQGNGATQGDTGRMPIPHVGTTVTTFYAMRARDPDCVSQPSYVYWVVTGVPDSTGAQYSGSRCGIHALVEIVVEATWSH